MLAGQRIPLNYKARYIGVLITTEGFTKEANQVIEKKCVAACGATTNKHVFNADIPNPSPRKLYRTNIRSVIMYGVMLTNNTSALNKLDRKVLSMNSKPIIQYKRKMSERLIYRSCLRIRLSSIDMEFGGSVNG